MTYLIVFQTYNRNGSPAKAVAEVTTDERKASAMFAELNERGTPVTLEMYAS